MESNLNPKLIEFNLYWYSAYFSVIIRLIIVAQTNARHKYQFFSTIILFDYTLKILFYVKQQDFWPD